MKSIRQSRAGLASAVWYSIATRRHSWRTAALAASLLFGIAATPRARANVIVNGGFAQVGPNGSPVLFSANGPQSGPSAAANWNQWKVVSTSYFESDIQPLGLGLAHALHVRTNGGLYAPWQTGNGFAQGFSPLPCVIASFWYRVTSGEVTGNLINGPAFAYAPIFSALGIWKPYSEVAVGTIQGLGFESLNAVGGEYYVTGVSAVPCTLAPPLKDVSPELAYDPFWRIKDPAAPVVDIRVTNVSRTAVQGPIHVLLENLTPGRTVLNPDGTYLGSHFMTLQAGTLQPGQSEVVSFQFNGDPSGALPAFRVKVATGGVN